MDDNIKIISYVFSASGIILLLLFLYYAFLHIRQNKYCKIQSISCLSSIFDMFFKLIQAGFIVCFVFYSDIAVNYIEAMRMDKIIKFYEKMYDYSVKKESLSTINIYMNELKLYIRNEIRNTIIKKLEEIGDKKIQSIILPDEHKILKDAISYFYEKKQPVILPEGISAAISKEFLKILSRYDMSVYPDKPELSEHAYALIGIIKNKKEIHFDIYSIDIFLSNLDHIIDDKVDNILKIISIYEPGIRSVIFDYSDLRNESAVKNILSDN
ncbi:hypothetical protein [Desulfovibrio sp.]